MIIISYDMRITVSLRLSDKIPVVDDCNYR